MRSLPLFAVCAALSFSCAASPDAYRRIDAGVGHGDFHGALAALEEDRGGVYPESAAVLLHLDRGLLRHYAGLHAESSEDLELAEELIQEAYTRSVSQSIASYIVNDTVRDYPGEDYEDMYINVFAALDYYHRGDLRGALVEIRKLTGKLDFLEVKYAEDVAKMEAYARSLSSGVRMPEGPPEVRFYNSALARYLSAVFYRGAGSLDDARIDFVRLADAWAAAPGIYPGPLPSYLVPGGPPGRETNGELDIPPGSARLNVVGFSGLGPVKVEREVRVYFPFAYIPDGVITIPVLQNRPSAITAVRVTASGGALERPLVFHLDLLEDMGAVMQAAFSRKYTIILIKTFVRTLVKYIAANAAGAVAAERSESALAGFLAARIAKVAIDASERADTRCSRYLPSLAWAGGVNLPPGEYTVTVQFYNGSHLAGSVQREGVSVRPGGTNLVEAVFLR